MPEWENLEQASRALPNPDGGIAFGLSRTMQTLAFNCDLQFLSSSSVSCTRGLSGHIAASLRVMAPPSRNSVLL